MCGIVGILGPDAGGAAARRCAEAARVSRLRLGRRRHARRRPAHPPPRRGQAPEPRGAARPRRRCSAMPASATPAGRPTARRPRPTPTRTPPTGVALVHNGIIENFRELRTELEARGRALRDRDRHRGHRPSDHREPRRGHDAGRGGRRRRSAGCAGAFALAILFEGEDDLLIGARRGSPLAIGYGEGEMFVGSDAHRAGAVHRPHHLSRGRRLGGADPRAARRSSTTSGSTRRTADGPRRSPRASLVEKGNHRHFMAKEIYEQPEVVGHTLAALSRLRRPDASRCRRLRHRLRQARPPVDHRLRHRLLCRPGRQILVRAASRGCRSTSMSPPSSAIASRRWTGNGLALFVSQSGETADTLAALRYAQGAGADDRRRRQRPRVDHRARGRPRSCRPRRARDRRRLDQGLHLPAGGAGVARASPPAARAGDLSRERRGAAGPARCTEAPRHDNAALQHDERRSRRWRQRSRRRATCSISAAARTIRWRWKAR